MDKQPVGTLPDLTASSLDDEIMIITDSKRSTLQKEKISDFLTDITSTDENNAIVKGTDGKLFTKDFGNASNITEGTLPVSVLPDIPKDKLPEIETGDLPDSGITAGTYTYPTDIVVNSKGQVTSITEGQAGANSANQDLSNLGPLGLDKLNQSKALETGSVSSDADVYADVLKYAHSTFDRSKFEVIGSPNITDDGIASGFSTANYITTPSSFNFASAQSFEILLAITTPSNTASVTSYTGFFNTLSSDNTEFIVVGYELENSRFVYGLGTTTGTFWNIYSSNTIQPDTKYYIKIKVDNTTVTIQISTNGTDWITDASGTISSPLNINNVLRFGLDRSLSQPFEGTIDLKYFSITADGIPVFSGNQTGIDIIKPDNYEVVGEPTITEDGIVSGINSSNAIPYTLSKTGSKIVDAAYRDRVQDVYEQYGTAMYYTLDEENQNFTLPMGDIYGMIEKKNEELNNPFSLFDSKYSETPVYNLSWLLSDGTYYSKSVYVTAYEALVVENNSEIEAGTSVTLPSGGNYVKRGLSVKLSTAEDITDFDFVINTTDETFKLPLLNGSEINIDYSQGVPITSGYIAPCNGVVSGGNNSLRNTSAVLRINDEIVAYAWGGNVIQDGTNIYVKVSKGDEITFTNLNTVEASTRNPVTFFPAAGNGLLYFYVGETVQNANLIDAGRIAELFTTKQFATSASFPSDRYTNLSLGASNSNYTAPADGYFVFDKSSTSSNQYVALVNTTSGVRSSNMSAGGSNPMSIFVPAKKNDTVNVQYNAGGSVIAFKFVYAEGAKND